MPKYTENLKKLTQIGNKILCIFPTFLGDWVFDKFHSPMSVHLAASKNIHYDWFIGEGEKPVDKHGRVFESWLHEQNNVGDSLVMADNLLKRVHMTLALTWVQMNEHDPNDEYNKPIKKLIQTVMAWQHEMVTVMGMDQVRVERDPPLHKDFIPHKFRDLHYSEERDLRDWIFLREARLVTDVLVQMFGYMVVHNV